MSRYSRSERHWWFGGFCLWLKNIYPDAVAKGQRSSMSDFLTMSTTKRSHIHIGRRRRLALEKLCKTECPAEFQNKSKSKGSLFSHLLCLVSY